MNATIKRTQRGISIIETTGALAIGTLMMIGLTSMINDSLEDSKGQQAASYHAQVVAAARKYISTYPSILVTASGGSGFTTISIDDLKSAKLLPDGFSLTNAYQQRTCVLVRPSVATTPGAPVTLDALVATYGGDKIKGIGAVAANAGPGSGYIRSDSTNTVRGASWQLTGAALEAYQGKICNDAVAPGKPVLTGGEDDADHLVSQIFFDGQPTADFLYRNPTSDPLANQMNVPIGMGTLAEVEIKQPCFFNAIAVTHEGKLASCVEAGGIRQWTLAESESSWKPPVDNYGALLALAPADNNYGDVRMTRDTGRAFMFDKPNDKWVALAVDENNNFLVPGDLKVVNDLTVENGNIRTNTGDISAAKNVHADGNVDAGMDVVAGWKVTGKHVIATQYMESENFTYVHREKFANGGACHTLMTNDQGAEAHAIPWGSYVQDLELNILYCDYDSTLKYVAGKAP